LLSALKAVSPPVNPGTDNVRVDNEMTTVLDYQRIRASIERALDSVDDPFVTAALKAMHGATMQMLLGLDGQSIYQFLQNAVGAQSNPQLAPPPPPPMGPPPMNPNIAPAPPIQGI